MHWAEEAISRSSVLASPVGGGESHQKASPVGGGESPQKASPVGDGENLSPVGGGESEKYAVLESSQHGFRGSRSVQLVIQKERWLLRQAMQQDTTLIRIDLDFKNAFNSAVHSCL